MNSWAGPGNEARLRMLETRTVFVERIATGWSLGNVWYWLKHILHSGWLCITSIGLPFLRERTHASINWITEYLSASLQEGTSEECSLTAEWGKENFFWRRMWVCDCQFASRSKLMSVILKTMHCVSTWHEGNKAVFWKSNPGPLWSYDR